MKNFNNLNSTSQPAEDNPKDNSQENDKSIEVSNFGGKPSLELFHNGARYGFFNRSISIRRSLLASVPIRR